jgi:putative transferase (TIGR04331 family)
MNIFCYTDLSVPSNSKTLSIYHLNSFWIIQKEYDSISLINIEKRDFTYLKENNNNEIITIYHDFLKFYKSYFNKLFQQNFSTRFYEILISKPVIEILTSFYYVMKDVEYLNENLESYANLKVAFYNIKLPNFYTSEELHDFLSSRMGSQFIFEYIISNDERFIELKNQFASFNFKKKETKRERFNFKKVLKRIIYTSLNYRIGQKDKVFIDFNASFNDIVKGNLFGKTYFYRDIACNQLFYRYEDVSVKKDITFDSNINKVITDFFNLCFPSIYFINPVEYSKIFNDFNLPKCVNQIYSLNVFSSYLTSLFKAVSIENGAKLTYVQHGGGYKVHKFLIHEYLERNTADFFIGAGKAIPNFETSVSNFINYNFHKKRFLKKRSKIENLKKIVTFQLLDNYYAEYIPISDVSSKLMPNYISRVESIIKYNFHNIDLKLQMYPHELSYDYLTYFKNKYPYIQNWERGLDSIKVYHKSDIVILTYLSTAILELAFINKPFILFLDSNLCYTNCFYPFLEELVFAKIVYYDSAELLYFLENKSTEDWFYSKNVQRIVSNFVENYCDSEDLYNIECLYK